jgi:Flp pilus assembly protein TadG
MKRHSNKGQATIEFALLLPVFLVTIFLMLGVLTVCMKQLALSDVARSAVRVAVTADDPPTAVESLLRNTSTSSTVSENQNGIIRVEVRQPIRLAFFALPTQVVQLRASASMMREPPIVLG